MPPKTRCISVVIGLCLTAGVVAQQKPAINWQQGPSVGKLGSVAQITVPAGYRFTDKLGAQKVLELTHNIVSGREAGAIVPQTNENGKFWFAVFEFSEVGYVKDDEKDKIDSAALLEAIKKSTESANKARQEKGWPAFHVVGWEREPFYNPTTHNLTWAIRGRSESGRDSVNYSIRVLGRHGTMNVDLVISPDQYAAVVPQFDSLIGGLSFLRGNQYADYVSGDKVAKYGLTALVAGGAGAVLLKTGLLAKFWKLLVGLLVAAIAAVRKLFKAMFRNEERAYQPNNTSGQG